jgi:hypothetical protein
MISIATFLSFLAALISPVIAAAINNTVSLPSNVWNYGDSNLLCTPAKWTDVLLFFLGNYVAHAATFVTVRCEGKADSYISSVAALLFPGYGLLRATTVIWNCPAAGKSTLEVATRAGALFMVVRSPYWKPVDGDCVENALLVQNNHSPKPIEGKGMFCKPIML